MCDVKLSGRWSRALVVLLLLVCSISSVSAAEKKDHFRVAWTIYAGWMPWAYATEMGIVGKWAKKYGISIEVIQVNDYIESINQFTLGKFDGCGMTNMDALTIPAASGVDTTGLILGDYSNGNDGIVLKDAKQFSDIKGRNVNLVELSVSHYLLARALEINGLAERDVKVVNTSDADAVSTFIMPSVNAAAIWNPQLSLVLEQSDNALEVFTSKQIPGEIIDMIAVNTEVLKANPEIAKAMVGAWFETLQLMARKDETAKQAITFMAKRAGTELPGFEAQLDDTALFYTPDAVYEFASNDQLYETMDKVRQFSFEKGLLGEGSRAC